MPLNKKVGKTFCGEIMQLTPHSIRPFFCLPKIQIEMISLSERMDFLCPEETLIARLCCVGNLKSFRLAIFTQININKFIQLYIDKQMKRNKLKTLIEAPCGVYTRSLMSCWSKANWIEEERNSYIWGQCLMIVERRLFIKCFGQRIRRKARLNSKLRMPYWKRENLSNSVQAS